MNPRVQEVLREFESGRMSVGQLSETLDTLEFTDEAPLPAADEGPRHAMLGLLGRGGMGEVWVAHDRYLRRHVAVKRMTAELAASAALATRFVQEVRITAQLDHPGIVPVYTFEPDEDGVPTYAMKLVRGETLERRLAEDHALPARLDWFLQVCNAIAYAHTRGVVHRDLKPENIMIGAFHEVLVMDWGLARRLASADDPAAVDLPEASTGTQLGTVVGTPAWMSPEQAQGRNDVVDARSDQYALGLILFQIVSLRRPIDGQTRDEVLGKAAGARLAPLVHAKGEAIPPELAAIVSRATSYRPEDRYADVQALADDVRRFLRDEAVLALPDTAVRRTLRWISHHREATLGAVLSLALAVVLVAATGLVGGLATLEIHREAAAKREKALGDVLSVATTQGHHVDTRFQDYQALLASLSSAATYALERPAPAAGAGDVHLPADFSDPARQPDDLLASPPYKEPISRRWPDFALAPGVAPDAVRGRLDQLVTLAPVLRETIDGGHHVPLVWAYVATEDGIITALPGSGQYPDGYDPRTQPWYRDGGPGPDGAPRRGPHWSPASNDESGMGLLVTCSEGLYDEGGKFLGTAAVDVSIDHIVHDLLVPDDLRGQVDAWLVDGDGQVVVGTSGEAPPASIAAVSGKAGHREDGGRLVVWAPLDALGWTYVVAGDESSLLGG